MNIAIVEAFIALRTYAANYNEIALKLSALEKKYNKQFNDVFEALKYLLEKDKKQTGPSSPEYSGSSG